VPKILEALDGHRAELLELARRLTGDPERAADLLQASWLKALRAESAPAGEAELVRWFRAILRRTWIDALRGAAVRRRADRELARALEHSSVEVAPPDPCACVNEVLSQLPRAQQDLLTRVAIDGESATTLAEREGVAVNTVHARVSRARKSLRAGVESTCGECAGDGCANCTC
jgi:RNA polymerase sigma-70 factor (ECF subfamily)